MFRKRSNETSTGSLRQAEFSLLTAVRDNNLQEVKTLCEASVDVNARFCKGATEKDLYKKIKTKSYDTPLSVAIKNGSNDIVTYLLTKGASLDQRAKIVYLCRPYLNDRRGHVNNLIGLACWSPVNHAVFKKLLRQAGGFDLVMHTHLLDDKMTLLEGLYREKKLPKEDADKRLALLICELILRNDQALLRCVNQEYCSELTEDFLRDYLSDIELSETQRDQAINSIKYLLSIKAITVDNCEKFKNVVIGKANLENQDLKVCEQEKEKEAPSQNDLAQQVAELVEQNRELRLLLTNQQAEMVEQIAALRRGQTQLLEMLAKSKVESEIKTDGKSSSPSFLREW